MEFQTAVKASRFVADNILYGNDALVEFQNATSLEIVRENFKERIEQRLKELGHTQSFWCEDNDAGAHFRLSE